MADGARVNDAVTQADPRRAERVDAEVARRREAAARQVEESAAVVRLSDDARRAIDDERG
jgi:hypothetical protein